MHIIVKATSKLKCCDWHVLSSALETQILKNEYCAKSYISIGFWRLQKIGIHDTHFIEFLKIHCCFTIGISAPKKVNLSLSHESTIRLLNRLGDGHDSLVKEWRGKATFSLLNEVIYS